MSERYNTNPNNIFPPGSDNPHTARYLLARGFVSPTERVVDAACGAGYGSALIAQVAGFVIAIDKEDTFLGEWKRPNIDFMVRDLETIDDPIICDTWISIETIEHLADPQKYLDYVTAHTGKKIIMTSPNKETVGLTPYHKTNVLLVNFQHYMNKYPDWVEYNSFLQGYVWVAIYMKKETKII